MTSPVFKRVAGLLALLWAVPVAAICPLTGTVPATAPDARYAVDDVNGIAVDQLTGLTWKRCPEGYDFLPPDPIDAVPATCLAGNLGTTFTSWNAALDQAVALNQAGGFAGQTDWRVPNQKELASLIERECFAPAINETVFPGTPSDWFWSASSTQDSTGAPGALLVDFFTGQAIFNPFAFGFEVPPSLRLVRGGP